MNLENIQQGPRAVIEKRKPIWRNKYAAQLGLLAAASFRAV